MTIEGTKIFHLLESGRYSKEIKHFTIQPTGLFLDAKVGALFLFTKSLLEVDQSEGSKVFYGSSQRPKQGKDPNGSKV